MRILRSFGDLADALRDDGVPHTCIEPEQAIEFIVNRPPLHTTAACVWRSDALLVQFAVPLPFVVPPHRMPMIESAVAWLNHLLILPGFDINHATNCVYYRAVFARRMDGTIDYEEIKGGLITSSNAAFEYFPLLRGVATEGAEPARSVQSVAIHRRVEEDPARHGDGPAWVPGFLRIGDDQ
jgi:hypothetical protein